MSSYASILPPLHSIGALNNYTQSQLVAVTLPSAVQPVAESRLNVLKPILLPVVNLELPPPRSHMQDNFCYVQQIMHFYRMQGIHRKSPKQLSIRMNKPAGR